MKPLADTAPRDTVLVVDDAPATLRWLCDTLEAESYAVLVARSGEEALARLEYLVPDAVLLDAMMPGLSGFQTCSRIKSNPAWSHVPVIFMTGLSETEDIVRGFDSGGVDYVVKPVRAGEILARLATHVRNARVARLARDAVDVGGLGVLLLDARGRIAWQSPRAERWLGDCFAPDQETRETASPEGSKLTRPVAPPQGWLDQVLALVAGEETLIERKGAPAFVARSLGRAGLDETMVLLQRRDPSAAASRIASAALTPRETEVLSWIAKGKTNRDIAEILGMSPRTVNKHLEHVFEKLGVETRAAAAALASRELG